MAQGLGVSMRALQMKFLKEYGFSPRDFILECRLDKARSMLLSGASIFGVTEVCYECGFPNPSHFAAKYRDRFGELPSETLKTVRQYENKPGEK